MNPLNSQHQSQTQFIITPITGMSPLVPAANSNLKPAAPPSMTTNLSSVGTNSQQATNHLLDANNFIASTQYFPVLLTNQTIITNVEQQQHHQPQQQLQLSKVPSNLINVTNSPVVTAGNIATFIPPPGKQQPMVMTSNQAGGGNITYQVLAAQQNPSLGSAVLAAQNGAVSVLLTTTSSQTMGTTSGHIVATPSSFLIRNTPTTLAAPNIPNAVSTQINNNKQPTQLQYQQQFQQQLLNQAFNTQHLNPEILKQIVVGNNTTSKSNSSTSGKTWLKAKVLQNKPTLSGTIHKPTKIVNKAKIIQAQQQQQQQQQKLKHSDIAQSGRISCDSTKTVGSSSQIANNNNKNFTAPPPSVQKLPQESLLQKNKPIKPKLNTSTNAPPMTTAISNMQNNEKRDVVLIKNSELHVPNLNTELSLLKHTTVNGEQSKELSLAAAKFLKEKQQQAQEAYFLMTSNTSSNSGGNNNTTSQSNSLLKSLAKSTIANANEIVPLERERKSIIHNSETNTNCAEKQESLLKYNKKNSENGHKTTSPRNKRAISCNSSLQATQSPEDSINGNVRRYSVPQALVTNIEVIKKPVVSKSDNFIGCKSEFEAQEELSNDTKSAALKKLNNFERLNIDSLTSQELDTLLDEFEDEEYLESSGERQDTQSNITPVTEVVPLQCQENDKIETNSVSEDVQVSAEIQELFAGKGENDAKSRLDQNRIAINNTENISDSDSDDDVTILPFNNPIPEPIEIEDDDDDDDADADGDDEEEETQTVISSESPSSSRLNKEKQDDLLLCDEHILISSSSSVSNLSSDQISSSSSSLLLQKSPKTSKTTPVSPLLKKSLTDTKLSPKLIKEEPMANGYSTVIDMLSTYNMLNWRERIGTARGTKLKFQLNEFNLIHIHEKIPNRTKYSYEKPIYERDNLQTRLESKEPIVYYMCRRCNVRASAVDFLAPEFCSLYCLRRDRRKRQQREDENLCILRKKQRSTTATSIGNNCNNNNNNNNDLDMPPLTYINQQPKFRWSNYLKVNFTSIAAPISLFLNPFPTGPNNFRIGMKLEAIDPENCSLFCACTVVAISGYRLKLSFDGYDSSYDFWLNADSMDIFPPGWCSKTNRILQPPKGFSANKFTWGGYLSRERATPAPRHLFTHLNSSSIMSRNQFEIGMHLEAEDLNDTGKLCVASVADVLDDRIRIHFDGWDDCYDIIVDINSPYIHPCGWHESRQQLVVPPDCENSTFNWEDYICKQGSGEAAADELFVPREPINFKPNMKLEVVDPRNSLFIRPATVVCHRGHRVKLHLDGWPNDYCFWLEDDSPDLHPIGWCDATGYDLEPPPGFQMAAQTMPCPINGCRGIGNAKKMFMNFHATRDCCPYAPENWRVVVDKTPRMGYDDIARTLPRQSKLITQQQNHYRLCGQELLERLEMLENMKTQNMLLQKDQNDATSRKDLVCSSTLPKVKREQNLPEDSVPLISTHSEKIEKEEEEEDPIEDINIKIAKEFLSDYGPRLQQSFSLWQKNVAFDNEMIKQNPITWLVSDVAAFIEKTLKFSEMRDVFMQEDIDGEAFLLLQQDDLMDSLGLKLGPAVKIYTSILQLRTLAVTKFNVAYRKAPKE